MAGSENLQLLGDLWQGERSPQGLDRVMQLCSESIHQDVIHRTVNVHIHHLHHTLSCTYVHTTIQDKLSYRNGQSDPGLKP
jgi:hypothetical protein